MAITETQLSTWANPGALATAKSTHDSIRHCLLDNSKSQVRDRKLDIFLQGSYKNDTLIRGDSDVDVVVLLEDTTIFYDYSRLSPLERLSVKLTLPTYPWVTFRSHVLATLRAYYGYAAVTERPNCIKVAAAPGRLTADVIVCIPHLLYANLATPPLEGVTFWTMAGEQVINYPKHHYDNGVEKNSAGQTNGWYKHTVRMFKNARAQLVDNRLLAAGVAPSYFVECLVYNAPNNCFGMSYQKTYGAVLNWMDTSATDSMFCKNGLTPLFGTGSTRWAAANARVLIASLSFQWRTW
jgi:hypothetical protein